MSLPAYMLPIAYHCGLAPELARQFRTESTAADAGLAYEALVQGDEAAPELLARLEPKERQRVEALPRPELPEGARHQVHFALDATGRSVEYNSLRRVVRGRADVTWPEQADQLLVVGDFKAGATWIEDGAESLQVAAAGFALADATGARAMRTGIYRAALGRWLWSEDIDLGSEKAAEMWRRILVAVERKPVAAPGPWCEGCWQRGHCPERLLPVLSGDVDEALKPFTVDGPPLTPSRAAVGLRVVAAMRDVADRAEEHIRAAVRDGLRIEQDGKVYGPSEVAGRVTADVGALERDGATQYLRVGKSYQRWGWRRA